MNRDRSDELALADDGLPQMGWLERLLIAGAVAVAAFALLDANAQPAADPVEQLPVWGLEICMRTPTIDDRLCWFMTATNLDKDTCTPIERLARIKFKGARRVLCQVDQERLAQVRPLAPSPTPLSGIAKAAR